MSDHKTYIDSYKKIYKDNNINLHSYYKKITSDYNDRKIDFKTFLVARLDNILEQFKKINIIYKTSLDVNVYKPYLINALNDAPVGLNISDFLEDINKIYYTGNDIKETDKLSLIGFINFFLLEIVKINYGYNKYKEETEYEIPEVVSVSDKKGGRRRNQPKHTDMTMKDIKELCKANQIKLSRVVDDKRVCYKKKELLTKLKRKKII
jgi:hypothetical protein